MLDYPLVSIIIATKNRAFFLPKTLTAITGQDYPKTEVIIVDNDSTDDTRKVVSQYPAQYIYCPKNGIGIARKTGGDNAQGEFIAFCDDDCIPHRNWVSKLMQRFNQEENIGIVAGLVNNIGGTGKGRGKIGRNGMTYYVENPYEADYFGNANLAFSRQRYHEVGGYDPFFSVGYEEIDLSIRFKQRGYKIVFEQEAVVDHHFTGVNCKRRWVYSHALMRLYFYLKHFQPKTGIEWLQFINYELYLLLRDIARSGKRFGKLLLPPYSIKKETMADIFIDLCNAILARLAIPVLLIRLHRSSVIADK